eukprot:GSChrysophyteH2.ASY1.ANO1.909.1 assembled CDS
MLSSFFGSLGDLVAPRPEPISELLSLIRSKQSSMAISLMDANPDLDINSRDPHSGLNALHVCSIVGDIMVCVELLSRGADVDVVSSAQKFRGYKPLHFAAMHNCKHVVEILMRSGADPSLPNESGQIPCELCQSEVIRNILLVDKTDIDQKVLSPIGLARQAQKASALDSSIDMTSENRNNLEDPREPLTRRSSDTSSSRADSGRSSGPTLNTSDSSTSPLLASPYKKHDNVPALDFSKISGKAFASSDVPVLVRPQSYRSDTSRSLNTTNSDGVAQNTQKNDTHSNIVNKSDSQTPTVNMMNSIHPPEYVDDLPILVLQAAEETSAAYLDQDLSLEDRLFIFKSCQVPPKDVKQVTKSLARLERMLSSRPELVHTRLIELGNFGNDGQTPIHVAAANGNLAVLQVLLASQNASVWIRDLQGRTPLHCATENVGAENYEVCKILRLAMYEERPDQDPVGDCAPLDLAGRTPLGRQNRQKKGISPQPSAQMQELLFYPGDRSVLPLSPVNERVGKSPIKANSVSFGGNNDLFAFSEASGWKPYMEDRVLIKCPYIRDLSWNLFTVLDGHGGSFCSQYLTDHLPRILATVADDVLSPKKVVTPEDLTLILKTGCAAAETELQTHPRMEVELNGSTLVGCLATPDYYTIFNIGDSRAVVGQYSLAADSVRCVWSTEDHKVSNMESEKSRAIESGVIVEGNSLKLGSVTQNVSRSFGDFVFKQNVNLSKEKQAVTAVPDITVFGRDVLDKFVVLACDGVFDVMSNEEICSFFSMRIFKEYEETNGGYSDSGDMLDILLQECLLRGSCDNMTVLIIIFGSAVITARNASNDDDAEKCLEDDEDVTKKLF